jgi:hypothetical protein
MPWSRTEAVPAGYPFQLPDDALKEVLGEMLTEIPGFDEYRALLPELKLTLILIGTLDRSRREADRLGRRSLWIAGAALAVGLVSLAVGIILSV